MASNNKLALITGASAGIGVAYARHAAALGHDVALVARRLDRLEALAEAMRAEFGVHVYPIKADLSEPSSAEMIIRTLRNVDRDIDILVNNAGFSIPKGFAWTSLEQQKNFMAVTVDTPLSLCHHVLDGMIKKRWGRIINVSSITAFSQGGKGHTLYPAGKSFLVKFSQSLNAEMRGYGIYVSAVCPGFVKTEFQIANNTSEKLRDTSGWFWQEPEDIVQESWRRNDNGVEVIVPGLAPKIMATILKYIPEPIITPVTRNAAAQHYAGDG